MVLLKEADSFFSGSGFTKQSNVFIYLSIDVAAPARKRGTAMAGREEPMQESAVGASTTSAHPSLQNLALTRRGPWKTSGVEDRPGKRQTDGTCYVVFFYVVFFCFSSSTDSSLIIPPSIQ